jgi:hypothetical protein
MPMFFLVKALKSRNMSAKESQKHSERSWTLPSLKTSGDLDNSYEWIVKTTQFSLAVCGLNDYEWIAYAFANSEAEELEEETEDNDEGDREDAEEVDSEHGAEDDSPFTDDPILRDGQLDIKYSQNPREYWMIGIDGRISRIIIQYKEVVKVTQMSVDEMVSLQTSLCFVVIISRGGY